MAPMNIRDDSATRHLSRNVHAGGVMAYCRDPGLYRDGKAFATRRHAEQWP
jgi:hypothetical protein